VHPGDSPGCPARLRASKMRAFQSAI